MGCNILESVLFYTRSIIAAYKNGGRQTAPYSAVPHNLVGVGALDDPFLLRLARVVEGADPYRVCARFGFLYTGILYV